jgi:DNA-binding HxlR family transcriptional regulator
VRTYGQYCPIARASEVLAERWTPIILRDLLNGSTTFSELAEGAPGLSRTLLTSRLRELERVGVVRAKPRPRGRGFVYALTEAGQDLGEVMVAMGRWGERWMRLAPEHLDPGVVLHSWITWYLAQERLPKRRVVVRFEFPDQPIKANRLWIIFDGEESEVCRTDPAFDEDLIVSAESRALAEWHLGRIEWAAATRSGRIQVSGAPQLARALPTWNHRSAWGRMERAPTPTAQKAHRRRTGARAATRTV